MVFYIMKIKLSQYANENGITYQTALLWYHKNIIDGAYKTPSGTIMVDTEISKKEETTNEVIEKKVVIYARVSNQSRRKEIQYQVDRLSEFSISRGYIISNVYKEVASGMNDSRKELWKMIESKPDIIVIENKDRLTRFGFEYLKRLLKEQGTEIIVVTQKDSEEDELLKDMISIITSFCCRLYGLRRSKNKIKQIQEIIENNNLEE